MLKLILGPAGSGKSRLLYDKIAELASQQKESLLIVPDSMSHLAERRLLLHCGNKVSRYARVCTLSRLAKDILAAAGDNTQYLDQGGRVLCMYRAISSLSGRLRYFDDRLQRPALVSAMLDTVNELISSGVSENHPALYSPNIGAKMEDIRDIYTAYMNICRAGSLDPALMLDRARETAASCSLLRDKHLFFDDFSSYSEQKMRFIESVRENCAGCTFTVMTNGDRVTFVDAHKMADRLLETATKKGEEHKVVTLPFAREGRCAELNALEQLFEADKTPYTGESSGCVQLYSAKDEREECELAAALVRRLTAIEGARLREVALVCGSEESYQGLVQGAFIRYGIPCFFSRREEVLKKPAFAAALGPLMCISDGMRLDTVLRYLRCGLLDADDDGLCKLENYALLWGISGKAWFEPFYKPTSGFETSFGDDGARLDALNNLRDKLMSPLNELKTRTGGTKTGGEFADIYLEHLAALKLRERFEKRIGKLQKGGKMQQAQEYAQLYDILMGAISQLKAVCGELNMDVGEFTKLLRLTLSQYDVSSIPSSLDSVTFGPFSRLSPYGIKHLIVLGARAGALPPDAPSGSMIGESERESLEKQGICLPRAEGKALSQQSDVYRAFNAPHCSLTVIRPRVGADGSAYQPSYVVSYMLKLLPNVREKDARDELYKLRLTAPAPAFELACSAGTKDAHFSAQAAYSHLSRDPEYARRLDYTRSFALSPKVKLNSLDTLKKLYGKDVSVNASAIEKFYSCPFAYFCQYGLRAHERKQADLGALEVGTMIHYIVENAVKALAQGRESDPAAASKRYAQEYIADLRGADSPRMQALLAQLQDNAAVVVQDVWDEVQHSDFKPAHFELNFSDNGDIAPYKWEKDGMSFALRGKIDRVDTWGDKLKVVDYKTGNKKYELSDILRGRNLQPFIYMLMLQRANMGENCAALFLPAKADYIDTEDVTEMGKIDEKRLASLRRMGLVRAESEILEALEHVSPGESPRWLPVNMGKDGTINLKKSSVAYKSQMERIISFAEQKIMDFSAAVASGDVSASPCADDSCKYCAFKSVCFAEDLKPGSNSISTSVTDRVLAVIDGEEEQENGQV